MNETGCFGVIYCVENLINGKKYVGQTTRSLKIRWQQHVRDSRREGSKGRRKFARALYEYGKNNFKIYVVDYANDYDELNEKEIFWIKKLDSFYDGYNSNLGGLGKGISEEVRMKISESSKNRKISEKTKIKMKESAKRNPYSFKEGKNHPFSRPVYKIDPDNFSIVEKFESISLASQKTENKIHGAISWAIQHKGSSGGYFWVYQEDYEKIKDFNTYFSNSIVVISQKKQEKIKKHKEYMSYKKCILQLDTNDFHIVNKFYSHKDILKYLHKNIRSDIIQEALRTKREKEGFYWIKQSEYDLIKTKDFSEIFFPKFISVSGNKILGSVQQIDDLGNVIKIWENCSYAQRTLFKKGNGIYSALKTGKKYKGYYWKLL